MKYFFIILSLFLHFAAKAQSGSGASPERAVAWTTLSNSECNATVRYRVYTADPGIPQLAIASFPGFENHIWDRWKIQIHLKYDDDGTTKNTIIFTDYLLVTDFISTGSIYEATRLVYDNEYSLPFGFQSIVEVPNAEVRAKFTKETFQNVYNYETKDFTPIKIKYAFGGEPIIESNYHKICSPENKWDRSSGDPSEPGDETDPNAQPNLTLSAFTVKVGGKTYDAFANDNNVPEFIKGEEHEFNITIENDDDGDAASSNYTLLVSEERKYPNISFGDAPAYQYRRENLGSIDGNSEETDTFYDTFFDFISSLRLENGKTYYLILDIDKVNNESNEDDNLFYIEFKYKSTTGKIRIVKDLETFYVDYNHSENTNNVLKLINLNGGAIIYQKTLRSNRDTVNLPNTTQAGLYGVYVNNTYIKKIGIGNLTDPLDVPLERP